MAEDSRRDLGDDFATKLFRGDYAITTSERREGTLLHYHLPNGREICIYPLLFDEFRLCTGRIDSDSWEKAYDYGTYEDAELAAMRWTDTEQPPPGPWIRERTPGVKT